MRSYWACYLHEVGVDKFLTSNTIRNSTWCQIEKYYSMKSLKKVLQKEECIENYGCYYKSLEGPHYHWKLKKLSVPCKRDMQVKRIGVKEPCMKNLTKDI